MAVSHSIGCPATAAVDVRPVARLRFQYRFHAAFSANFQCDTELQSKDCRKVGVRLPGRCDMSFTFIPTKPENIEAWLNPTASSLETMYAILDDKDRPYYEHKLAA
ncbi:hypothetical protein [Burkholderia ubonensis]|uniref:hypothetical protein n=1 Tax=Burkholderia ubonensis TaxID=101571 RepID=UPI000759AC2E|nr:hypothetical protein [Burkholderia ubonensis]KVS41453.1 hypothetical protein WK37_20005 [Burkholderia ubonensis]KVT20035.1 hypothetical protein WK49_25795 [Burkholderia ubonensis]